MSDGAPELGPVGKTIAIVIALILTVWLIYQMFANIGPGAY